MSLFMDSLETSPNSLALANVRSTEGAIGTLDQIMTYQFYVGNQS